MSKVITFSRVFPTYHPKRGQPTYFVEKIKPYNSKQIVIAPDIEIVKIYDFKVTPSLYYLDNNSYDINDLELLYKISNNDGLTLNELRAWFKFPCDFEGQIICWGEVNYG